MLIFLPELSKKSTNDEPKKSVTIPSHLQHLASPQIASGGLPPDPRDPRDKNKTPLENPAHDIIQYEKLKSDLKVNGFTSIIKVTDHGLQRLLERGFTPQEVQTLVNSPDIIKTQADGAKVFIKCIGDNKYNLMVYNGEKEAVITVLRNAGKEKIINMGRNYGWTL